MPVTSVDESNRVVAFGKRNVFALSRGDQYYIENVFEALDAPGEWYLDHTTGKLSYRPLPGEDVTTAEVIAPALPELMRITGASGITFRGLTFAHSEWNLPANFKAEWPKPDVGGFYQAAAGLPGAIVLAWRDDETSQLAQAALGALHFRIYRTEDVVGVMMGGALKFVVAIGAGVSDGLGFGSNTRVALMTRGLA